MDTKHLSYMLTIADKKNITKAADELSVSPSYLSQYLSKLELDMGTPLFVDKKGELTLTSAGILYTEASKKMVQIKNELFQNIQALNHNVHITIGVTSQFGLRLLTDVIPIYREDYPEVTIDISEVNVSDLTKMLLDESMDCGIVAINTPKTFSPEQVMMMRREEVYFAIPSTHPYCRLNPDKPITQIQLIREFQNENFILSKKGSTLRYLADQIFSEYDFHPGTMCEVSSIMDAHTMTAQEIGVTFIAKSCAVISDKVVYYPMLPSLYRYNAFVSRKNWMQNRSERKLVAAICDYFEEANDFG